MYRVESSVLERCLDTEMLPSFYWVYSFPCFVFLQNIFSFIPWFSMVKRAAGGSALYKLRLCGLWFMVCCRDLEMEEKPLASMFTVMPSPLKFCPTQQTQQGAELTTFPAPILIQPHFIGFRGRGK